MEEMGIIQGYSVVIDPESVGWNMTIMAGLMIAKGKMIDVQQKNSGRPYRYFRYMT